MRKMGHEGRAEAAGGRDGLGAMLVASLYGSVLALMGLATTAAELWSTDPRHATTLAVCAAVVVGQFAATLVAMRVVAPATASTGPEGPRPPG